jgi:hypothetical protein
MLIMVHNNILDMESFNNVMKALILFSPVIAFSIAVWLVARWEKKNRPKKLDESEQSEYVKRRMRVGLLLWFIGLVATMVFVTLWAKLIPLGVK